MTQADWGTDSLLALVAEWPAKHAGRYVDLATVLAKTAEQEPRKTAAMLKALGDVDLIRVRGAVDLDFVGLSRSKVLLHEFRAKIETLSRDGRKAEDVRSAFQKESARLARRELAATPEPSETAIGLRHHSHYRHAVAGSFHAPH